MQGLPLHPLHDDERLTFVLANIVDRADVGMVQCGCRPRFDSEAFDGLSIARQFLGDELECDRPAKAGVVGAVHDAHATGSQLIDHPIVSDCFANHTEGFERFVARCPTRRAMARRL
jgi:hypothetical protein